jgi:molybdopterin synthase catalytic subunit
MKHKLVGFFRDDSEVDIESRVKEIIQKVKGRGVGAILVFVGVVKDVVDGYKVYELHYEAYEDYAIKVLDKIASDELSKDGVEAVEILHRVGPAREGEKTLYIAVAAQSRKQAIESLSRILERVKHEPPIYKLEKREDGECYVVGDGERVKREKL